MSTENLERAIASTAAVLRNVTPDQYDLPTPCASWKVRDLLNHIIGGAYWFAETVNTGTAPTGDDDPESQNDFTAGDIVASFTEGAKQAVAAFSAEGALEKLLTLPFGQFPGAAFLMLATNDVFTHGWDLAKATGQSTDLDPELAAQILGAARMMIPDQFRGPEGSGAPFGPAVEAGDGAPTADQLAALLGRQV